MDLEALWYGLALILPYLVTCLFPILVIYQAWLFVRYIWQRQKAASHCPKCGGKLPEHNATCDWKPPKFPIFSAIIIGACVLVFAVAFLNFRP